MFHEVTEKFDAALYIALFLYCPGKVVPDNEVVLEAVKQEGSALLLVISILS